MTDSERWATAVIVFVLAALVAGAFLCILGLQDRAARLESCVEHPRHVVVRSGEFYAEGCGGG